MRRLLTALILAIALALVAADLTAQTCFRGGPAPRCRSFVVTEIGYSMRLAAPSAQRHYLNGELGWMTNRPGRASLGATLFAGGLVDYAFQLRLGAKARYRRWLGANSALDAGAGPMLFRDGSLRAGITSDLSWTWQDRITFLAQLELAPSPTAPDLGWYVGARLGGKTAMWTGLIGGALMGIGAAMYGGG